jgi:hypothetical protein
MQRIVRQARNTQSAPCALCITRKAAQNTEQGKLYPLESATPSIHPQFAPILYLVHFDASWGVHAVGCMPPYIPAYMPTRLPRG